MSLLVANRPRHQVVDHLGFDTAATLRALVAVDTVGTRASDASNLCTIRSWAAVPVEHDDIEVGTLFVADRRRRWFDDEEVRHLGLMSSVAARLIIERTALDLVEAVDVREPLTSLA